MRRKESLIRRLREVRQRIRQVASSLTVDQQDEVFLGIWTIKDLLAHLIGWDYTNIEAASEIRAGKLPTVFQGWDEDWATYNAGLVQKYQRKEMQEILELMERSHGALIEHIQAIADDEIEKDFGVRTPGGEELTIGSLLRFEIEDEERHYHQILAWLDR